MIRSVTRTNTATPPAIIPAISHQREEVAPAAAAEVAVDVLDGAGKDADGATGEGVGVIGGVAVVVTGTEGDGLVVTLVVRDGTAVGLGEDVDVGVGVSVAVPIGEGVGEGVETGGVTTVPRSA